MQQLMQVKWASCFISPPLMSLLFQFSSYQAVVILEIIKRLSFKSATAV